MAEGLGAGGVEECKGVLPPRVLATNAASPRVPLDSLVSNTPTTTPSRRTLTEDLDSTEALRSAVTVERARFAQRTEEMRLHKAHQRCARGGAFLQHLDATGSTGEYITLYMKGTVVHSRLFLGW